MNGELGQMCAPPPTEDRAETAEGWWNSLHKKHFITCALACLCLGLAYLTQTQVHAKPTTRKATPTSKLHKRDFKQPTPETIPPPCPHLEGNVCFLWNMCWKGRQQQCKLLADAYAYAPASKGKHEALMAHLRTKCNKRDKASCRWLLIAINRGIGQKARPMKAIRTSITLCNALPSFCTDVLQLQRMYHFNHPKKSRKIVYKRSCLWGHALSCFRWGQALERRMLAHSKLRSQAMQAFTIGCRSKHAPSCFQKAVLLQYSLIPLPTVSKRKRAKEQGQIAMLQACRYGHKTACKILINALLIGDGLPKSCALATALRFHTGDKTPIASVTCDPDKTPTPNTAAIKHTVALRIIALLLDKIRTKCIQEGGHVCSILGDLLAEDLDLEAQTSLASASYEVACRNSPARGCFQLAKWYRKHTPTNTRLQWALFHRACKAGNGAACRQVRKELPPTYFMESWFVSRQDAARIDRGWLRKACQLRDGKACRILSKHAKSIQNLTKGCSFGDADSCLMLAKTQPNKRREMYQRACSLHDGKACFQLVRLSDEGAGFLSRRQRIRYTRLACGQQHQEACIARALSLRENRYARQRKASHRMLKQLCRKKNHVSSCLYTAENRAWGIGTRWQPHRARRELNKLCKHPKAHRHEACVSLAYMKQKGIGSNVDAEEAFTLFKTLCKAGALHSCRHAVYTASKRGPVPPSLLQHLYQNCTHRKFVGACIDLRNIRRRYHKTKRPWPKRMLVARAWKQKLRKRLRRQCEAGIKSICHIYAEALSKGWGGHSDVTKANETLRKNCQMGYTNSCASVARKLRKNKEKQNFTLDYRLCKRQFGHNCYQMANAMLKRWKMSHRAFKRYKRSRYSSYRRYTRNAKRYRKRMLNGYKKACRLGTGISCHILAIFSIKGKSYYSLLDKQPNQHKKYLKRACNLDFSRSCWKLSQLPSIAPKLQQKFKQRACALGFKKACPPTSTSKPAKKGN